MSICGASVDVMFVDKTWVRDDAYISRRHEMANMPGAWEATSAARFKAPFRDASGPSERDRIDYAAIACPVLVFAGRQDVLRNPGYTDGFVPKIPNCQPARFSSTLDTWARSSAPMSSMPRCWRFSSTDPHRRDWLIRSRQDVAPDVLDVAMPMEQMRMPVEGSANWSVAV